LSSYSANHSSSFQSSSSRASRIRKSDISLWTFFCSPMLFPLLCQPHNRLPVAPKSSLRRFVTESTDSFTIRNNLFFSKAATQVKPFSPRSVQCALATVKYINIVGSNHPRYSDPSLYVIHASVTNALIDTVY